MPPKDAVTTPTTVAITSGLGSEEILAYRINNS